MAGACIATDLRVDTVVTGDSSTITIKMYLCNTSSNTIALADMAVRFWYSRDGASGGEQTVDVDYSPSGGLAVVEAMSTPTVEATHAVVYTWPATNLAAGTCAETQSRVHTSTYANGYDWTNDWSYLESEGTTPATNLKTAIYAGEDIVWGCDPAGLGPHCQGAGTGGTAGTGGVATGTGGAATGTGGVATGTGGVATGTGGAATGTGGAATGTGGG
jgi:hypothetical protein